MNRVKHLCSFEQKQTSACYIEVPSGAAQLSEAQMWMTVSTPLLPWLIARAIDPTPAEGSMAAGIVNGLLMSVPLWIGIWCSVQWVCS